MRPSLSRRKDTDNEVARKYFFFLILCVSLLFYPSVYIVRGVVETHSAYDAGRDGATKRACLL